MNGWFDKNPAHRTDSEAENQHVCSSVIRKMQGKVNLACALKNFIRTPGFDFPAVKIVYEVQLHTRHFGNSFLILQKKRNLVLTTPKIRKKRCISNITKTQEMQDFVGNCP
jgi:hypothetical protein